MTPKERGESSNLSPVTINSREPIRGIRQKRAYLEKYLVPLLDGRLVVPRKNMRLDYEVEGIVAKCLNCCPKDSFAKISLALQIAEETPYPAAKAKALRLLNDQLQQLRQDQIQEHRPLLQDAVQKLVGVSDLSAEERVKSDSFDVAVSIAEALIPNPYQLQRNEKAAVSCPDYFPTFFQSLSCETDVKCFAGKFVAISRYLRAASHALDPQTRERWTNQLLNFTQRSVEANDPLAAVNLIFTVMWRYTYRCLDGIIFEKPPFDLATLQRICREAPPEQREEVFRTVKRKLMELNRHNVMRSYGNNGLYGSQSLQEALVCYALKAS